MQGSYDKLIAEVPKYKMITPSVLADRLRVRAGLMVWCPDITTPMHGLTVDWSNLAVWACLTARDTVWLQINGSLARAAIRDLAEKGTIRVVSKSGHQEIWTRATNTDAA